jgi:tellurite methyltransferase
MINYYWDKFYKKKLKISKPSSFAKFVFNYLKKNKSIIDIGCGNGRDSFFFNKKNLDVIGVEKSKTAIDNNNKIIFQKKLRNISFKNIDINSDKFNKTKKFDFIYSRFFIHAISKKTENKLFKDIKKISKKNSLIFFEFRTTKDPLYKEGKKLSKFERYTDHYRRFINFDKFIDDLKKNKNFIIIYKIEKKGLAKYGTDNPVVGRVILKINEKSKKK